MVKYHRSNRKMFQIQRDESEWCVITPAPWKSITGGKYVAVYFCKSKREAREWIANKKQAIKKGW